VLGSGSSGNTTLVEAQGTRLLVDAGLSCREMGERLESAGVDPATLSAVLVSHEHQDHARGAAAFSRRWGVRLMGSRGTRAALSLPDGDIAGYDVLEPNQVRQVGAITVRPLPVPHDAAAPFAFVLSCGDTAIGHATDLGHLQRGLVEAFRACDAVLIESNYDPGMLRDGSYPWSVKARILGAWGHLSNDDIGRYLAQGLGEACRTVVLAHLSQNNNHPELVRMTAEQALRRRGRSEVKLTLTTAEGTDWLDVEPPPGAPRAAKQLRLF
jgi:phosphoribosyl 1,2-cyclic phosphodiesterase